MPVADTVPHRGHDITPGDARRAALNRWNAARARAFDADRRGDFHAAARFRTDARGARADLLDLPDPAVDEVGEWLTCKLAAFDWCREMAEHYRTAGDAEAAAGWRRDMLAAEVEVRRLKETLADNLLKGLRFAAEVAPDTLAAVLRAAVGTGDAAVRAELAELRGAVAELAERMGVAP